MISIKNFTKSYGNFKAVDNLSFEVNKGEIVGFVGKNGAGKSTTIRSMMNFINPDSGTITIDGLDSNKDSKKIRSIVSYMTSETVFYENIKVEKLLEFVCEFSPSTKEDIQKLAQYFELDLNKKLGDLSLGNKKKVAIISALLKKAKILILDEPTNGLDPLMQNKFFELLLKEKERGATIFLSSHNLSEIEKYCDKVIIIKDGKLMDYLDMSNVKLKYKQIVSYTTTDGKSESYEFDKDINELIKKLSTLSLTSLEIKNSTVEDEFINYYKGEE